MGRFMTTRVIIGYPFSVSKLTLRSCISYDAVYISHIFPNGQHHVCQYPGVCKPWIAISWIRQPKKNKGISVCNLINTLIEESSQTNVILQYKLLAAILSAVCSVNQQS